MSKVTPKKFTLEEFQEQAKWIGPLFSGLNQFIQDVVSGFSNSLSVKENLFQEIKEIKWVNQPQDYPLSFRTKFVVNPKGLLPIYLLNNTAGNFSIAAPWVVWSYADGQVKISNISGLTSGSTYTIRLLVIYE
jgi:hypothetical protein